MTYCIACERPMEPTDRRECGGGMYCRPMAAKRDLLPDYVESLRDDLKRAVELLEEYARHDVTCSCLCCGMPWGEPWHKDECAIGNFIKRVEST